MIVTAIIAQQKDPNRVNVMIDGKFRLSLDIAQVIDLRIKVGGEYTEDELRDFETESQFGKLYALSLEYCLVRPRSSKEIRDYLFRKTITRRYRSRRNGDICERPGVSVAITNRVYKRLVDRGYVDDRKFAQYWYENRNQRKGSSIRKLRSELLEKGVAMEIIDECFRQTLRNDADELQKIILKKRHRYTDDRKFMQYLARQGFQFDVIKSALDKMEE